MNAFVSKLGSVSQRTLFFFFKKQGIKPMDIQSKEDDQQ